MEDRFESDGEQPEPRWSGLLAALPLLVLLVTGLRSLDFGTHWDEDIAFIQPLQESIRRGHPLPGRYNYPSVGYDLTLAATLPEILAARRAGLSRPERVERVVDHVATQGFRLRLRALFLILTASGVLFTFLAGRALGRGSLESLLAATLVGTSFEVATHARWITSDGLLMAAGAACLWLSAAALRSSRPFAWILAATIVAGVGCGTKYPGGLLILLPGLATTAVLWRGSGAPAARALSIAGAGLGLGLLFATVYLVTTPGTIVQWKSFWEGIEFERQHYASDGHGIYTVQPGLHHAWRVLHYLSTQLFSPHLGLALLAFVLAPIGLVAGLRHPRFGMALLLLLPVCYLAYMTRMRVLMVRNLLVLVPFLALFSARGLDALLERFARDRAKLGTAACVALLLIGNGAALELAGRSIRARETHTPAALLLEGLRGELVEERIHLSSGVTRALEGLATEEELAAWRPNGLDDRHVLAVMRSELPVETQWDFDVLRTRWVGPREVNYVFYPTFPEEKIFLLGIEHARRMGVPVDALLPAP